MIKLSRHFNAGFNLLYKLGQVLVFGVALIIGNILYSLEIISINYH